MPKDNILNIPKTQLVYLNILLSRLKSRSNTTEAEEIENNYSCN